MLGRFLFGILSGTALVVCGLVVAAALFPLPTTGPTTVTAGPATVVPDPVVPEIAPEVSADTPIEPTIPDVPGVLAIEAEPAETDADILTDSLSVAEPEPEPPLEAPHSPEVEPPQETTPIDSATDGAVASADVTPPEASAEAIAPALDTAGDPDAGLETEAVSPKSSTVVGTEPSVAEADEDTAIAGAVKEPAPDTPPDGPAAAPTAVPELATLPDRLDILPDPAPQPSTEASSAETTVIAEPKPELNRTEDGIIINRLPRIGDPPVDAADAAGAPTATTPLTEFAEPFANPDKKPVFAIVLIDPGTDDLDRAGLAALPFPVSFALDPLDPATPDRVAIYRAGGKEVVMLATGIAEGAQASDIEVAFQSMAQGLPEAVAVMDVDGSLFQNNRPVASLVVPVVAAQGRGLLTWDVGLNAADQVARREDVPAGVVFRDLAASGDDGAAIQRILGRAVFKAGQDGRVAVAATASPGLVATLLEWTVEGKAASVALAPLSAVLTVE